MTPEELKALIQEKRQAATIEPSEKPTADLAFNLFPKDLRARLIQAGEFGYTQMPPWKREGRRPTPGETTLFTERAKKFIGQERELIFKQELNKAYDQAAGWWGRKLGIDTKKSERFGTFMFQGLTDYLTFGEIWRKRAGFHLEPVSEYDRLGEAAGFALAIGLCGKFRIPHPLGIAGKHVESFMRTVTKLNTPRKLLGSLYLSKHGHKVHQVMNSTLTFMYHGGLRNLLKQIQRTWREDEKFSVTELSRTVREGALMGVVFGASGTVFEGYAKNIAAAFLTGSIYRKVRGESTIESIGGGLIFAMLAATEAPKKRREAMKVQAYMLGHKHLEAFYNQKFPKASKGEIAVLTNKAMLQFTQRLPKVWEKVTFKQVDSWRSDIVKYIQAQKPTKAPKGVIPGRRYADMVQMRVAKGEKLEDAINWVKKHVVGINMKFTDKETGNKIYIPGTEVKESPITVTMHPHLKAKQRAKSRLSEEAFNETINTVESRVARVVSGNPNIIQLLKIHGVDPKTVEVKIEKIVTRKQVQAGELKGRVPLEYVTPTVISISTPAWTTVKAKGAAPFNITINLGEAKHGFIPSPTKAKLERVPIKMVKRMRTQQFSFIHELAHNLIARVPKKEIAKWKTIVQKDKKLQAMTKMFTEHPSWALVHPEKFTYWLERACDFTAFTSLNKGKMQKYHPKAYAWIKKNIWKGHDPLYPTSKPKVTIVPPRVQNLEVTQYRKPKLLKHPGLEVVAKHYTTEEGLKELKVKFFGKGELPEAQREGRVKKVFFYHVGAKRVEPMFQAKKAKYYATLSHIYPAKSDPLGLWKVAKGNIGKFERLVKQAGYLGFLTDRDVIVSFVNVKVQPPTGFGRAMEFGTTKEVRQFFTDPKVRQQRLAYKEAGALMYTPFTGKATSQTNLRKLRAEGKWLKDNDYEFVNITGRTKQWGDELGFMVATNKKRLGPLIDRAFTKYKQEAIIFMGNDGNIMAINSDMTGEVTSKVPLFDRNVGENYSMIHTPTGTVKFAFDLYQTSPQPLMKTFGTWVKYFGINQVSKWKNKVPYKQTRENQPAITSAGADPKDPMTAKSGIPYETPPPEVVSSVDRALATWYGNTNAAFFRGIKTAELFENKINPVIRTALKGIRKVRQYKGKALEQQKARIDRGVEEPNFRKTLSIKDQKICEEIHVHLDRLWKVANSAGILQAYIENYLPHLYRDKPDRVRKWIYGVTKGKLGTRPRFTMERKYPTSTDAEAAGLTPIRDPAAKLQIYEQALYRAIANKRLVTFLKNTTNEQGLPVLMAMRKAPHDYQMLNIRGLDSFLGYRTGKGQTVLFRQPVKCDPKIAKTLKDIFDPYTPASGWRQAYYRIRGGVKRMIIYNPAIHGTNILSDVFDEVSFHPVKTAKIFRRGGELWRLHDQRVIDALEHGLNLSGVSRTAHDLHEKLTPGFRARKIPILSKAAHFNDKILWNNIVRNAQLGIYEMKLDQLARKGMKPNEAKFASAHFTNDLLGTLPHIWMTRTQREVLSGLFFARNWTLSNLRLVTGTLGVHSQHKFKIKGKEIGLPQFLMHKGLPAELQPLRKQYGIHLAKGLFGLVMFSNLMQMGFQAISKKPITTTFENEHGHIFDIDTGRLDTKERKIYVKPHFFRYIADLMGWVVRPRQTFWNKVEPLLKLTTEFSMEVSGFRKKRIVAPGATFWDKRLKELEYMVKSVTPADVLTGRPGEVRSWLEIAIPFTGTWVRHGIAPNLKRRWDGIPKRDRATLIADMNTEERSNLVQGLLGKLSHNREADLALKVMRFQAKQRYKREKLDDQIDALIQHGEIAEAIRIMILERRYSTREGIMQRLERFNLEGILED